MRLEIILPDDLAEWLARQPSSDGEQDLTLAEKVQQIVEERREAVEDERRHWRLMQALGLAGKDDEIDI